MATFSWRDHIVKLVRVINGVTAEKRLYSGNKAAFEPGPKATVQKGFDPRPFGIIYNAAEPKWSLDGMSAPEVQDAVEFVGLIYGPQFSVVTVIQRPGQVTRTVKCVLAAIGEGGDWTADEGSGATGKLGGPMQDLLYARGSAPLRSIYANRVR